MGESELEWAICGANKAEFLVALWDAVEKLGVDKVCEKTGIERTNFYKVLRPHANPTLDTLIKILYALELRIEVKKI